MSKKEIVELIGLVEDNIYCSMEDASWLSDESEGFDHVGEIPIYILDAVVSELNTNNRYNIIFTAIQPSGNVLKFSKQYEYYDEAGYHKLPSKRSYSMTIARYALIKVKTCKQRNGDKVLRVVDFNIIPDEEILKIINEMNKIEEHIA